MSTPASSRALAILSACAVILGSLTLASPAMAEADPSSSSSPAPEATPESTPDASEPPADASTPSPEPSESSTPAPETEAPAAVPSAASAASPEFVNYTGRVTRLSEDDAEETFSSSVHLFRVTGQGYLRVDTSRLDLGKSLFDQVTLKLAVPAGLDLSADDDEAFLQLALASTSVAPLVAVERVVQNSRLRNSLGTDSLINKTPAATALHKVYAVLVTPAGGAASAAANQTAAKVQASVTHADGFWAQQSGGLVHFELEGTTDWYQSTHSCTTDAGSTALWNEAFAAASSQLGMEDALNTHLVLFFPSDTDCGGGIGLGTIGYSVNSGGASWVIGTDAPMEQATLAHELGHNLSFGHASWTQCSASDPHPGFFGDSGCTFHAYGDAVDVMGFGTPGKDGGALSSPTAIRSGLWASSAYAFAPLGTTTHVLNSVSSNSGKRAVVVEDVDGVNYFVEFRNLTGEDAQYVGYPCDAEACVAPDSGVRVLRMEQQVFTDGVFDYLFKGYPGDDSLLIGRTVGGNPKVDYDVGESFNSQVGGASGVTITVTAVNAAAGTATVSVTKRSAALNGSYVTLVPTITHDDDDLRVGDTLTGFLEADWTANSFAFQWYRTTGANVRTAITGATGQSYVLTSADIGRYLSVKATGTVGSSTSYSIDPDPAYYLGYGAILGGIMDPGTVSIDATTSPFKASLDGWTTPGTAFTYQWTRNGGNIVGATVSSYTPTAADRGQLLGLTVKGSKAGYDTVTVSSAAADFTLYATGTLAINGTLKVGHTVSVNELDYSTIGGSVPATVAYQWYRNGVAIPGVQAQALDYVLVSADYNLPITAKATATYPGTIAHSATAAAAGSIVKGDIAGSLLAPVVTIDAANKLIATLPVGSVTEAGVASAYQWFRGATAIVGATASTYTLTAADYGQLIRVRLTVTKSNYNTLTLNSTPTNFSITATGVLEVGGVLKVGKILQPSVLDYSTTAGAVSPTLSYQWLRSGVVIPGPAGTVEDYVLTAADFGKAMSVRVTAALGGYATLVRTSTATALIGKGGLQGDLSLPVVTKAPDSLVLQSTLSGTSVTDAGTSTTRQWYRGAVAIVGQTGANYTLTALDYGQSVSVRYTVAKSNYASVVLASTPVNYSLAASGNPTISGVIKVGNQLTAVPPTYSTTGNPTVVPGGFVYGWFRTGVLIPGSSTSSGQYILQAADFGKAITVKVTPVYPDAVVQARTSAATALVAKGVIAVSGDAPVVTKSGAVLTVAPALGSIMEPGTTLGYQWYRGATAIVGKTAASYTLTVADYGALISARVIVSKLNFTSVVLPSTSANYSVIANFPPSIFGGVAVDETLYTSTGVYTAGGSDVTGAVTRQYQWLRGGVSIAGETGWSYSLTPLDLGKAISVRITAIYDGYVPSTATIAAAVPVGLQLMDGWDALPHAVLGKTGSPFTLSVASTGVTETPVTTKYQWYRGATALPAPLGTAPTYKLVPADAGQLIKVRVTITKPGFTTVIKDSVPTSYTLVSNGAPWITAGSYAVGTMLQADIVPPAYGGDGQPATATVTWQWLRAGVPIAGADATDSDYTLVAADYGKVITVRATATAPGYLPIALTKATTPITKGQIQGTWAQPVVTKNPATLTLDVTLEEHTIDEPGVAYAYQWFRDVTPVAGKTATSYQLGDADADVSVWVQVTVTKLNYASAVLTSTPRNDALYSQWQPGISGVGKVGSELTVDLPHYTTVDGDVPMNDPTYEWFRSGVVIPGATGDHYTVVAADYGKVLTVRVTRTADGYIRDRNTTAGTAPIAKGTIDVASVDPEVALNTNTFQLTASMPDGSVNEPGVATAYQWLSNGAVIPGATTAVFQLTPAYQGKGVSVRVTISKLNYTTETRESWPVDYSVTASMPPVIEALGGAEGAENEVAVGATLAIVPRYYYADGGVVTPELEYEWMRAGVVVSDQETYPLTPADIGKAISVRVTATLDEHIPSVATSAATQPIGMFSLDGSIAQSHAVVSHDTATKVLTMSGTGVTEPGMATTYQWYRGLTAVVGKTLASYALTTADYGQNVWVQVTHKKATFTTVVKTSVPTDYTLFVTGTPVITGTLKVGKTLTVSPLDYSTTTEGPVGPSITRQWYRSGVAIPLATGETYVLVAADLGKAMSVRVTGAYGGYVTLTKASASTALITPGVALVAGGVPSITGTERVGEQLQATAPGYTASGGAATPGIAYQWTRNGAVIAGAISDTYTLVAADYGKTIAVRAVATLSEFLPNTTISFGTSPVARGVIGGSFEVPVVTEDTDDVLVAELPVGSVTEPGVVLTYQWYRASSPIPYATASSYSLTAADHGASMWVKVTATKANYTPVVLSSVPAVFFFGS